MAATIEDDPVRSPAVGWWLVCVGREDLDPGSPNPE